MLQNFIFSFFLIILSFSNLSADDNVEFLPNLQRIEAFELYEGDAKGKFRGNTVIILADGSAWKVDPKDCDKVSRWCLDDLVHIGVRTSFFIIRHHKYLIHNHVLNESARVMLVRYPQEYLQIIDAQTYLASQEYYYGLFYGAYVKNKYEKRILLNDGSTFVLTRSKDFKYFSVGNKVYVGVNSTKAGFFYYLISGLGTIGKFGKALRLN